MRVESEPFGRFVVCLNQTLTNNFAKKNLHKQRCTRKPP